MVASSQRRRALGHPTATALMHRPPRMYFYRRARLCLSLAPRVISLLRSNRVALGAKQTPTSLRHAIQFISTRPRRVPINHAALDVCYAFDSGGEAEIA